MLFSRIGKEVLYRGIAHETFGLGEACADGRRRVRHRSPRPLRRRLRAGAWAFLPGHSSGFQAMFQASMVFYG